MEALAGFGPSELLVAARRGVRHMPPPTWIPRRSPARVEAGPGLAVVDFTAGWCPPCRQIAPQVDALARERAPAVLIAKVDADEHPALAARFGVRGLPTLLLFRDGELIDRIVGALPPAQLRARIQGPGADRKRWPRSPWRAPPPFGTTHGAVEPIVMRTLFIDDEPEASDAAVEPTGPDLQRRYRIYLFVGVNFVAYGLILQWLWPTTTLRCERPASGIAACVASDRILAGLMPTETRALAGVRGARVKAQKGIRRAKDQSRYHVMLDTAGGRQRDLTWSHSLETADQLARTIDERLRGGAPFEVTLGYAFWDWVWRGLILLATASGAGQAARAALALVRYRRSSATQPCG